MKAAIYREIQGNISIENLDDPEPARDGVVVAVKANGVCRSDWHGWMGHDADIRLRLRYLQRMSVGQPAGLSIAGTTRLHTLGCRFATAYRAVVVQARAAEGEWLAIHGCGGVGLSAVMIAAARGVQVLAIDIDDAKLEFARSVGATATLRADQVNDVGTAVSELTNGGAHASIEAVGGARQMRASIDSLRRRGRFACQ